MSTSNTLGPNSVIYGPGGAVGPHGAVMSSRERNRLRHSVPSASTIAETAETLDTPQREDTTAATLAALLLRVDEQERRIVALERQGATATQKAHPGWIDAVEAARRLGVDRSHVSYLLKVGRIVGVRDKKRPGRPWCIDPESVARYAPSVRRRKTTAGLTCPCCHEPIDDGTALCERCAA